MPDERPRLHFTPPTGWMNDPCGLTRTGDTWHLFYQHNPDARVWGNIHWGHATSLDLADWTDHPIALAPDELGLIFTGCCVRDVEDTAGFGADALVAVFTQAGPLGQVQSLAFSTDGGASWSMFDGNPVLAPPEGVKDHRDPKVVRHGDGPDRAWVMLLAVGETIEVHRSNDLRHWSASSVFRPDPRPGIILEVPDLVAVPGPDGDPIWLLLYSVIPADTEASSRRLVHWQAVDFDGHQLVALGPTGVVDHGPSFYAALTWPADGEPPIVVGWMDESLPEVAGDRREWCGRLSTPRQLTLERRAGELVLRQSPVLGRAANPTHQVEPDDDVVIDLLDRASITRLETAELEPKSGYELQLIDREGDEIAMLEVTSTRITLSATDHPDPTTVHAIGAGQTTIVIDAGSVELFAEDGACAISTTTLPSVPHAVKVRNRTGVLVTLSVRAALSH